MSIASEIERLQAAKNDIATSLTNRGAIVPEDARIDEYAPIIDGLQGGGNYQEKKVTPSNEYQVITPDDGYDALSKVMVVETPLEEKTVTPTTTDVIVMPEGENVGLSKVTVAGDNNLISNNIRSGVEIFDVLGTYKPAGTDGDMNLSGFGSTVTVQAETDIPDGARIVGRKNDDYTVTLASNSSNASIYTLSADGSVGIGYVYNITEGTIIPIYFLNEAGTYDLYNLTIDSIPSNVPHLGGTPIINDTGTLAMCSHYVSKNNATSYEHAILIIEIDKNNKSATYDITTYSSPTIELKVETKVDENGEPYERTTIATVDAPVIRQKDASLVGNYLLCMATAHVTIAETGEFINSQNVFGIYSYRKGDLTCIHRDTIYASASASTEYRPWNTNAVFYDDDTILYALRDNAQRSYGRMYCISEKINRPISAGNSSSSQQVNGLYFSRNGRAYSKILANGSTTICKTTRKINIVYDEEVGDFYERVNFGGSIINHVGTGDAYVNDDGTLVLKGDGIYDVDTNKKISNGGCTPASGFFDETKWIDRQVGHDSTIYSLLQTNAQYIISEMISSSMNLNRIYGVANEALSIGEEGTAQKIFDTYNMDIKFQTKEVLPSDIDQTIIADDGYDGLEKVTVTGDSDLKAVNIRKGVEIFGVTGTLEESSGGGDDDSIQYVEYIEASGTQYIDTGIIANQDTCIDMRFQVTSGGWFFGSRTSSTSKDMWGFYLSNPTTGEATYYYMNAGSREYSGINLKTGEHTLTTFKLVAYLDGNTYSITRTKATFTCPTTLKLLACDTNGTFESLMFKGKIYEVKIYNKYDLIQHLKPALDENGVYCFYDKITKQYVYNAGTGVFTGGGAVS